MTTKTTTTTRKPHTVTLDGVTYRLAIAWAYEPCEKGSPCDLYRVIGTRADGAQFDYRSADLRNAAADGNVGAAMILAEVENMRPWLLGLELGSKVREAKEAVSDLVASGVNRATATGYVRDAQDAMWSAVRRGVASRAATEIGMSK